MHLQLDLAASTWHFKRAARGHDGSWSPGLELASRDGHGDALQHQGSNDTRLDSWMSIDVIPNDPFLLLQAAGIIRDPAIGLNEADVQWVGETDWVFRCIFNTPEDLDGESKSVDLLVDGLDTFATVYINDKKCHTSENGFVSYRISLTHYMRKKRGDGNVLMFHFASAFREGRKLELKHGKRACWNGDSSRVYVRKPQYHYGWDWGPTLLTSGILGIPSLHFYTHRLHDLQVETQDNKIIVKTLVLGRRGPAPRNNDPSSVSLFTLKLKIEVIFGHTRLEHEYSLGDEEGFVMGDSECGSSKGSLPAAFEGTQLCRAFTMLNVQYWWPVGQGEQPLYIVRLTLFSGADETLCILDQEERRTAFRKIELVQQPFADQPGTSFFFRVNDRPIFLAGSNWIPANSYPNRVTREDYRQLLRLLVQSGQNSLRVWGGGYYESEDFYDLCDEMGILVWQDFMFACAAYPADVKDFRDNVAMEAVQVVKRLSHHAGLALFAGNNEDYQIAEAEKLEWNPDNRNPEDWLKTSFPAKYLYEHGLPEAVKKHSKVAYHPGSPWKTGSDTRDPTKGDIHQWNVWHGSQEDYQGWDKLGGRFVSEFGMHALPDIRTIESFAGKDRIDQHPQSRIMDMHNKATGGITRLSQYMIKNLKYGMEVQDYVYASQLMQADCLGTAYQLWRREWRGPGKEYCGGALVWQLDDVYPCISWSIVDFHKRPKLAYYAIKCVCQRITINLKRVQEVSHPDPLSNRQIVQHAVEIWTCNSTQDGLSAKLEISVICIVDGKRVSSKSQPVHLLPNCSSELFREAVPADIEQDVVVVARLYNLHAERELLAETISWPEPLRFVKGDQALVTYDFDDRDILRVRADRPVKGVTFAFDDDVYMEDNGFDLIPGAERQIQVSAVNPEAAPNKICRPTCRWYNAPIS